MRSALLAAATALAALAIATPAAANGRFPASNQIAFAPNDPNLVVLRSTYGILVSHDDAATWYWLCEDTIGLPPTSNADPVLGITASSSFIAGIPHGLEVSPDQGCNWSFIDGGLANQLVKDLVVRPDDPHRALVILSTFANDAGVDGSSGYDQQLFASADDGTSWAPVGTPIDPQAIVTTVEVAKSDPQRVYVSGFRGAGATRTTSLFVSTDGGTTWTERPTPFNPMTESAVYIAAVDPANADRVYVRSEGQSRLMVTNDAGKTFQTPLTLQGQMLGFALSPDGSKVYVGGPQDGLQVASTTDFTFAKTSTIHVQCLATRAGELWACSDEPSGFVAGMSTDDGRTFTPKLHLNGISGPLACAANSTAAQCAGGPYDQLCQNLGGCLSDQPEGGAEAEEGGAGGGGGGSTPPKSSCGCSVVGGGGAAGALAGAGILLLAARRRRATGGRR